MRDYASAERRADDIRAILNGDADKAAKAERAERYAGVVRIERGPAAFRITFPMLSAHERGTDEARAAWDAAKRPMADVKAIPGRTFSKLDVAWLVPITEAASVELLAEEYGATIEAVTDANAERVAELERQVAILTDERDAALRLADEYAATLERLAEAADTAYQAAAIPGEDTSGWFAEAQARANGKRYIVQTIRSTGRALDEDRTDNLDRAKVRADGFGAHFPAQVIDNDTGAVVYATGKAVAA